jgi:hypothetical protein
MRTFRLPLCIALSATAILSCGPAPDAVAPSGAATSAPPPAAAAPLKQVAAASPANLSPVAEPADMVAVIRWKNPKAMASALSSCANLPLPRQAMDQGAQGLAEGLLNEVLRSRTAAKQLAPLVVLDAPVDGVATLDVAQRRRNVLFALSVGLSSLEQAKAAVESLGPAVELSPGVFRVGTKETQRDAACVLSASAGSSPARLVCGPKEKDATTLAPYLTRTMSVAAPAQADLHGEFRIAPIDARFGGMLRQQLSALPVLAQAELGIDDQKLERAVIETAATVSDELGTILSDLDKITVDIGLNPTSCGEISAALQLRGRSSWLAGTLTERPERAGPPPPIFWRAPKDSRGVGYGRGSDSARFAGILRSLRILLESALASENIGAPADRKALADLIRLPIGSDVASVTASGDVTEPAAARPSAQQRFDSKMSKWLGWNLFGFEEGPESLTKFFKDLVSAYDRKGLMTPLRKELGNDAKWLPSIKLVPPPAPLGPGALDIEVKLSDLPEGEINFEARDMASKKKPEKVTFSAHLLLMPDGKRTWLAFGVNRDELVKRLRSVKSDAPDSGTIAARTDLQMLKSGRHMSAGFTSLRGILASFDSFGDMGRALPSEARRVLQALPSMPNHGETPLLLATTVTTGNTARIETSFKIPKGAFEDLGSLVIKSMKVAGP